MEFDFVTSFFEKALESISVTYILSSNFIIFFIIKSFDQLNNEKAISQINKIFITGATCIILAGLFLWQNYAPGDVILTSSLLVPITYKYVIKFFLEKFNIHYRKEDIKSTF